MSDTRRSTRFRPRVWAPLADRVELVVDDERRPLEPVHDGPVDPHRHLDLGWWQLPPDAEGLPAGADYAFSIDGGQPRPDPRSAWQPAGVHGPSRVVDTGAFEWTDEGWTGFDLPTAVLYELHVGTFTDEGTFDAAVGRLDHLVDLGVTAVEVMPINAFPGRHGWGYDGVALYAVHDAYGGPAAFARFVDACHDAGLGVVLDVVYNHLGPDGNHLGEFGPYFTDRYGTPWGQAVNLDDAHSDHVRRFVIDNALRWLREFHVDALRLDAVHALFDESAIHLLEQLSTEVDALATELGRSLHLIAESDLNDPRLVEPRDRGGYGLTASWSDDLHHALHTMLTHERDGYYVDFAAAQDVARALEHGWVYDGRYSVHRQRSHGRPLPDHVPGTRLIGYVQNHDQVGNRARGERLTDLVDDPGLLAIGAAVVLTAPQVPMLFMGEEWGATTPFPYVTDHQDPDLAEAVRQGRRSEFGAFGWAPEDVLDPQDPEVFASGRLRWDERSEGKHRDLLAWYRDLIALRRSVAALTDGDRSRVQAVTGDGLLLIERGPVLVACNASAEVQRVPRPVGRSDELLLAWPSTPDDLGDEHEVVLPPYGALVFGDEDARDRLEEHRASR